MPADTVRSSSHAKRSNRAAVGRAWSPNKRSEHSSNISPRNNRSPRSGRGYSPISSFRALLENEDLEEDNEQARKQRELETAREKAKNDLRLTKKGFNFGRFIALKSQRHTNITNIAQASPAEMRTRKTKVARVQRLDSFGLDIANDSLQQDSEVPTDL
jgi:hypothetical protein